MLHSEIQDLAYIVKNTEQVIIDYKEFIVVNSEVIAFLADVLNPAELGKVLKLSNTIKTNWNILHNKKTNKPFDDIGLSEEMQYTRNKFYDFMNKMYKLSVVYKLKGYWGGVLKTVYILNPHLAKSTKSSNKEILMEFEDISNTKTQERLKNMLLKVNK
jgi:hypothetical protein